MEKRNDALSNIQRVLNQLEKALNRICRQNCLLPGQRHPLFGAIENAIGKMRQWIGKFRAFAGLDGFFTVLGLCVKVLAKMIDCLAEKIKPVAGKKRTSKTLREKQRRALFRSVDSMLERVSELIAEARPKNNPICLELEKAIFRAFEIHCAQEVEKSEERLVSGRGEKTYVFPWGDPDGYDELIEDKNEFKSFAMEFLKKNAHATGHRTTCEDRTGYRLCGFRSKPRRTFASEGKREFRIRMVQCSSCGRRFSMVPSFLPREKHWCLNVIGRVLDNVLRFGMSIQGALENLKLLKDPVKSKQTVLNWLGWLGTLHPAAVLTRAGVEGSGYLQEDEGFEKEPNLRTYSVVMVDPANMLVWHSDYVDGVDEDTLVASFERFVEKIRFTILGATKDRWLSSTA